MRFLVYGYFEGVLLNFFHFFGSIWILAQESNKISNLQLGMCLLTHFMAKTVLRKEFTRSEFYGFWPIWRSEYQYFPLFLVLVHQYIKSICFTRGMKRWAKYLIQETCIHSESEVIKIFLSSLPTIKLEMIVSVLVLLQVHDIWHKKTKFMYHL